MQGHSVRKDYMRKFAGLTKSSRIVAAAIVANYLAQVLGAIAVGYVVLQNPMTATNGLIVAVLAIFIGTRLRGFNNIVHECSHFTFSQKREDNVWLGSFCASMVLGCYQDYRDEHLTHHMHLGDYEKDMDLNGLRELRLEEKLSAATIIRHIVTPFLGLHLPYYLGINLSRRDGAGFRAMKISLILLATLFLLVAPIPALLLVWIPFVWVYSSINYWTDCMDHGGVLHAEDELESSRNMLAPSPIRMLFFPRNDCFHLVHHLFPQVPAQHLESCHNQLLAHPDYLATTTRADKRGAYAQKHAT